MTKEKGGWGGVVFVVFAEGTWTGGASFRPRWASPWGLGLVLLFAMTTGERENKAEMRIGWLLAQSSH